MKTIEDYKPRKKSDTPIAYFHYFDEGEVVYQGYIKELKKDQTGTCQLFEWLSGSESDEIHVTKSFFDDCTFYDSDYQMNSAYEKYSKTR